MAPTIGVNIRVTGHCNQGSRRHMEDMFSVAYQQTEDELDLEYAYFGIFDGHGGHEAATFAKEHLMKAIISEPGFWSDDDKDVLRAIKDGFIATHYAMWRNLEKWPKTQSGWPSTSGTTASIAFIRRSNVYIGHVGDSCIVLGYKDPCSSQWRGAPLTRDHKPENPTELERISEAGGTVVTKSGVPRVVWQRPRIPNKGPLTRSTHIDQIPFLAVARSLGDLWSYNADSDRFVVSPEPDVSVYHLDVSRDRCLIFGTDGLWNMLTPDEAVSIVEKAEGFNKEGGVDSQDNTWLNPSKCLVDHALKKWIKFKLRADNTSAVTLILGASGRPHSEILSHQRAASRPQEFVPYYIESYNVTEEKLPTKVHSQSSGLAICTWYPHKNLSDHLNGMTTLSTMEELFGKKVEVCDRSKGENDADDDAEKEEESNMKPTFPLFLKCASSKTISQKALENKKYPSAVKFPNQNINNNNNSNNNKELESKKYPSAVKFPNRNSGTSNSEGDEKTVQKVMKEISTKVEETTEGKKEKPVNLISGDENDNHEVDENVNKMKLRDSSMTNKIPPESKIENDLSATKNYQKTSLRSKSLRRTCKRGKKRKNYEMIKSQLNLLDDTIMLRTRSKRRHSSLLETVSLMYEPRPKRRTRSEDQKKLSDCEEYKSDTENTLSEDSNKSRKMTKLQSKTSEVDMRPETPEENSRQNHLQERLQHSNNSNSNQLNNSTINSNNNNSNNSNSNNSSSVQDFTPMRLRSNMPVKTLRSRNINLEISDWFLLGLPKINVNANKKSLPKQSYKPEESHSDHHKNLSKLSVLTRGSMNATKIQMNDSPHRSAVHTRSQNKRLKK